MPASSQVQDENASYTANPCKRSSSKEHFDVETRYSAEDSSEVARKRLKRAVRRVMQNIANTSQPQEGLVKENAEAYVCELGSVENTDDSANDLGVVAETAAAEAPPFFTQLSEIEAARTEPTSAEEERLNISSTTKPALSSLASSLSVTANQSTKKVANKSAEKSTNKSGSRLGVFSRLWSDAANRKVSNAAKRSELYDLAVFPVEQKSGDSSFTAGSRYHNSTFETKSLTVGSVQPAMTTPPKRQVFARLWSDAQTHFRPKTAVVPGPGAYSDSSPLKLAIKRRASGSFMSHTPRLLESKARSPGPGVYESYKQSKNPNPIASWKRESKVQRDVFNTKFSATDTMGPGSYYNEGDSQFTPRQRRPSSAFVSHSERFAKTDCFQVAKPTRYDLAV